jgi:hypothetical protein
VKRLKAGKLTRKKYLVAIPVPGLDRNGKRLMENTVQKWVKLAEKELTDCFGGATPIPSWGTNVIDGKILYEKGQMLVYSTCDSRRDFIEKRNRIQAFVERMGKDLDQEFVFVLACPSDSFLIEIERRSQSK